MGEHYATDVPRHTRIVAPAEHAGAVIRDVRFEGFCDPDAEARVLLDTDRGEVALAPGDRVEVESTPEREARLAHARALLGEAS